MIIEDIEKGTIMIDYLRKSRENIKK